MILAKIIVTGGRIIRVGVIITLILCSASCYTIKGEPMVVPAAMAPSRTYSLGNGEAGIKTTGYLPGPDLKIGLGRHVDLTGTYYPYTSLYQLLEAGIDVGIGNWKQSTVSFGGGDYVSITQGDMTNSMYHNSHYYIYQGFYPAVYRLAEHFSVRPLVKVYEYFGNYYYGMPTQNNHFAGVEFMPEVDGLLEWQHLSLRFGLSVPILSSIGGMAGLKPFLQRDTASDAVYLVPIFSVGLYGKW